MSDYEIWDTNEWIKLDFITQISSVFDGLGTSGKEMPLTVFYNFFFTMYVYERKNLRSLNVVIKVM